MKQWIALLFCAVLLMTAVCPVWAEESTTTEPAETTTEPSEEITEPTESETTTSPVRYAVFLTITYEKREIVIRAKDANGQPVRNAPVNVTADGQSFSGHTNDGGVATFPMAEEPAQVFCSTEAFKGSILYYEAASASVTLHTTSPSTTTTGTTETTPTSTVYRAVFLTITYENQNILIRVKDANGQPVPNAPVKVAADREQLSGRTNDTGVVTFPMAEEPAQIICSTEPFTEAGVHYEAASASVILHTPSSASTATTTLASSTTKRPSTSYITGTSVTWTTSDPLEGNVTVTEIITSSSVVEDEEEEEVNLQPAPKKSPLPNGWALALMIMGGVLLIVSAVVLCLFLFRAPRMPVETTEAAEEEVPAFVPAEMPVEEPVETAETVEAMEILADVTDETAADPIGETAVLSETVGETVSLEDLFRNQ